MTEFQKKRLKYFIKAAEKGEWVQLGKGDVEIFGLLAFWENCYTELFPEEVAKQKAEDNFMDEF